MAGDLDLAIRVRADLNRAVRDIRKLERGLGKAGDESRDAAGEAKGVAGSWDRMAVAARAAAGAVAALGLAAAARAAVDAGVAMERLESRFRQATGSSQAAAREIAFVRAEAERLGVNFEAAADAHSGFAAAAKGTALEGEAARQVFTAVAEAARVMGSSTDDTRGAFRALEQIMSKGTVQAEELRGQLGERLPGAFQIAARAMGVSTKELGRMLERGEVLADEFLPKFAAELRRSVAGALPEAVETAQAAFERLENRILDLKAAIAESGILDFFAALAAGAAKALKAVQEAVRGPSIDDRLSGLLTGWAGGHARRRRDEILAAAAPGLLLETVKTRETISKETARRLREANEDLAEALRIDPRLIDAAAGDTEAAIEILSGHLAVVDAAVDEAARAVEGAVPKAETAARRRVEVLKAQAAELRALIAEFEAPPPPEATAEAGGGEAGTEAGRKAIAQLERRLALTGELSQEQAALYEIEKGRFKEFSQAEKDRVLTLAREADVLAALTKEATERAKAEDEAHKAAREASEEIQAAVLDLLPPYERARAGIKQWLADTLKALKEGAEGHEDYAQRVAEAHRAAEARLKEIEEEEAERRLRDSKRWQDGVIRGLRDYAEEAADAATAMEEATEGALRSMEDALVEFVRTGKLSFSDLVDSIIADFARIAIRQQITGPLASALGAIIPNLVGSLFGGGPATTGFSLQGNTFSRHALGFPVGHAGTVAGSLGGVRRLAPPELFLGAPRYHRGGIAGMLKPGEVPIIARRGEEIVPETDPRHARNLAMPPIHIEFVNQGAPQREVDREVRWDLDRWVLSIVVDNIERGPVGKAIENTYGVRRRTF